MCNAVHQRNAILFIKNIIYTITIGLQVTSKIFKYLHRSFASTAFLVIEEYYLFNAVVIYPVVASVRFPVFILIHYLNGCFIYMQVTAVKYLFFQRFKQWLY